MKALILGLLTLSLVVSAHGKSPFDNVGKKLGKCYSRTYSQSHLNKHPKQTVTHMAAKMSLLHIDTDNDGTKHYEPILKIQAKRRIKKNGRWVQDETVYGIELECNDETGNCFIPCDGPQVDIRFSTNNPGSLLVDNAKNRLVLDPLTCDGEMVEKVSLFLKATQGGDDIFLLKPVADFQCL